MKLLEGIRVLDLTNVLSGPFASLHFALLGAEVIKIENPHDGDIARKNGCVPEYNEKLMGTSFIAQNANKKSVTVNLKDDKGKEIFKELTKTADVVIENFRPGVMKRLGLDYDILKEVNPRIIYCAISGFGQTGPDAKNPAYDQIIQGLSGVMAINGDKTLNPLRTGFPVCDTVGGLNAAFSVMAALYYREAKGEGQFIDVSLLDSIMPLVGWIVSNWMIGGQPPVLVGNENFTTAPSGVFKSKDGHINIAANKQEQWERLADLIEMPELKKDPRFIDREARVKNRDVLRELLNKIIIKNNTSFWVDLLTENGIPAGPIIKLEDALTAPQIKHRNTFSKINVDGVGAVELFNATAKFAKTPGKAENPPPKLSEHTNDILSGIGYSDEEIKDLRNKKII